MTQIKVKHIDAVFERIAKAYEGTGNKLVLEQGSATYGRAWRLFFDEGGYVNFPGLSNGYLGWTRREAYQTLQGIEAGMEAAKLLWGSQLRVAVESFPIKPADGRGIRDVVDEMAPPTEF